MNNTRTARPGKPGYLGWLLRGLYMLCALLVLLDFVVDRQVKQDLENWPAFYPLYGFAVCVVLVQLTRGLRKLVQRPDGYYQRLAETEKDKGALHGDD